MSHQSMATKITMTYWLLACLSLAILAMPFAEAQMIPFASQQQPIARIRGVGTTKVQAAATSIIVNKPTGVTTGDVLYAVVWVNNSTNRATVTPPTGWTSLGSVDGTGFLGKVYRNYLFRRVSDGTDGASYTFTFSISQSYSMATVIAYSDADQATPEDATPSLTVTKTTATTMTYTGVTTSTKNAKVLAVFMSGSANDNVVAPTGATPPWYEISSGPDATNAQAINGFERTQSEPGATGSFTSSSFAPGSGYNYVGTAIFAVKSRRTCGGSWYNGFCWYLSAASTASCTTTCSTHGGTVDAGTINFVGSVGTLANCQAVASRLGITGTLSDNATCGSQTGGGVGCFPRTSGGGSRCLDSATAQGATYSGALTDSRRVCSCAN